MPMTTTNTSRAKWDRPALRLTALCFVASVVCFAGCNFPGQPNPADRPIPADQVLSFSILYGQNCAGCHGASGKLGPAPPLNDELFRAIVPQAEVEDVVTNGRHKSLMPAFAKASGGTLTPTQIQVLVHEIKGIPYRIDAKCDGGMASAEVLADPSGTAPKWGPVAKVPDGVPAYRQSAGAGYDMGTGSSGQGVLVFSRACAVCHGKDGQGIADGSKTRRTINDPVTLKLISDQLLRRYLITGRPDLGMPNFAGPRPDSPHFQPLTDQEISDLVAHLASWRQTAAPNDIVKE